MANDDGEEKGKKSNSSADKRFVFNVLYKKQARQFVLSPKRARRAILLLEKLVEKDIKNDFDAFRLKHGTIHHINPTSLGGPRKAWNVYPWTKVKHQTWYQLFYNYFPSEAIATIEKHWTLPDGTLNQEKMGESFVKAWEEVFDNWSPQQAIAFIQREFLPAEIKYFAELHEPKVKKKKAG